MSDAPDGRPVALGRRAVLAGTASVVGSSVVGRVAAREERELTLGGEGRYVFRDVATDGAAVYLAGTAPGEDGTAAWVVRLLEGRPTWLETFGDGDTRATGVATHPSGGAVVAGATVAAGTDDERGWVLAVDADGRRRWRLTFPEETGVARSVAVAPNGDVLLCGRADSGLTGVEGWLARVTDDGDRRWTRRYGDDLRVAFNDLAVVDGQPRVVGLVSPRGDTGEGVLATVATGGGLRDPLRFDFDGVATAGTALVPTADGAVVAGTHEADRDHFEVWAAGVDGGDRRWRARFDRSRRDRLADAVRRPDGGVLLAGRTDERSGSARDAWVLAVDGDGEKAWGRTFGAGADDRADGVAVRSDRYVVAGKRTTAEGPQGWVAVRPLDDAPPSALPEGVPGVGVAGGLAGLAGGLAALRRWRS